MNRKFIASLSVFALLLTIYSSCSRIDTTDIGNGLIPVVDNVNTFDTIYDVITDNYLFDDSSRIFDNEDHALGVIQNDPIFGRISAGIYFNVSPATFGAYPFINKDSIKLPIDSVILSLSYAGVYGDSMVTQNFNIFEIADDSRFTDTAAGFLIRNTPVNTLGQLGPTHIQNFDRLNDAYVINLGKDTQNIKNQMRIRLNNSLGERLINYDTATHFKNDSAFRKAFAGIAILPAGGAQNALAYFNLKNADTKLTVYYKAKSLNGIVDTSLVTNFTFINYRNLNTITRTINGTEYSNAMNPGTPSDEKVYIATSPGSYATVRIPNLHSLSNRVIHKAELIATPINTPGTIYQEPYYLFVDAYDSVAKLPRTIQNDFTYNSTTGQYNQTLFGGFLRNGSYTFDLSRYVQGIATRKETSYTLRLYAPYKSAAVYVPQGVEANYPSSSLVGLDTTYKKQGFSLYLNPQIAYGRTVLAGGSYPNAATRMRLRIIYSKI